MKRFGILTAATAILVALVGTARADSCENFTAQYEAANGIPGQLLTAIARAESGRYDAESGVAQAWPWTVTSPEGDIKYATKWEAIDAVRELKRRGVTNIDVGCMQINLRYHPNAFRSLDHAFDPEANVAYAARFLMQQYDRTGDWRTAVAYYHSSNPEHYGPYVAKVEALWQLARADARFYGFDDVQVGAAGSDTDWAAYRNYPTWADPHWTATRWADDSGQPTWRRWTHHWSRPIRWYGDRGVTGAGTDVSDHVGPWRPVGTTRFN